MRGARPVRSAGRVKGIAQADEGEDVQLVRNHARHASAEGLAADGERPSTKTSCRLPPRIQEEGFAVWGTAHAGCSARSHVGKLETQDLDVWPGDALGEGFHEGAVHWCTRTMGKQQSKRGPRASVEQQFLCSPGRQPIGGGRRLLSGGVVELAL